MVWCKSSKSTPPRIRMVTLGTPVIQEKVYPTWKIASTSEHRMPSMWKMILITFILFCQNCNYVHCVYVCFNEVNLCLSHIHTHTYTHIKCIINQVFPLSCAASRPFACACARTHKSCRVRNFTCCAKTNNTATFSFQFPCVNPCSLWLKKNIIKLHEFVKSMDFNFFFF